MDTKKSARFLLVLQIYVYLFINKSYCQQVYSSHKKKAAQNILSTLSKIPYNTTKHLWGNEDKPTVRQEDFLIKMNHWFEAIGMKFRF